jgi:hypothetical protein
VAETLGKGTDPGANFLNNSSSIVMYIVGGIILLVVLGMVSKMMKNGQSPVFPSSSSLSSLSSPKSRFRALGDIAYKLRNKMEPNQLVSLETMIGVAVLLSLLVGALYLVLKKR